MFSTNIRIYFEEASENTQRNLLSGAGGGHVKVKFSQRPNKTEIHSTIINTQFLFSEKAGSHPVYKNYNQRQIFPLYTE